MPLVNVKDMMGKALEGHYAVGQFNINNLEWTKQILLAAEEAQSPVILGVSEGAAKYMTGYKVVADMVKAMIETLNITVPVAIHLDHGTFEGAQKALAAGFSSVMFDGSHYDIEENIAKTKAIVELAHAQGATVEAEVGSIGGEEDGVTGRGEVADPAQCKLIADLGIDILAAGIGNIHGQYPANWQGLDFDALAKIQAACGNMPLVLHGGTGIPEVMIKEAILKVYKHENLTYDEAYQTMDEIMSGEASEVQMSAYLTAMSMKGETIDEITASAEAMRAHCVRLLNDKEVLEIVGTGGDGSNTFNISTTSSIVISAAGVPVAKHGNRAASSKCGAADVLEELGVNINIPPEKSLKCLKKINLCFLFAQNYHLSMKYVAGVRKELSIRTIFNILGPLTHPAGATMQALGVYDKDLVEPLTEVIKNLGVKSALVVYGLDVMDEISVSDKTFVCGLKDGKTMSYEISPEYFDMEFSSKEDLVGGDAKENAKITLSILNGEKGPRRNAVLLNSAAGLYVAGKVESLREGVSLAAEIIDSGKALEQLEKFIECTNC